MQDKKDEGVDVKRLKEIYRESGTILSDEEANALSDLIEKAVNEVLSEEAGQGNIGKGRIKNEP
ncbi:hypothetical protein D3C78_1843970 [compost metagenome]